ncbi:hypothetical protein Tco_0330992 [Tanacetum coccineum]
MSTLKFAEAHNMVVFLEKPTDSEGFKQIIDFLNASSIKYALIVNPTIYVSSLIQFWTTDEVKKVNGIRIESLERKVKKLEKSKNKRTHKLKRLYKIGLSARVMSSNDEESGEGRDEEMMFDAKKDLAGEEVMVEKVVAKVVTEKVNVEEVNLNEDEITLSKTLQKLKATPKAKIVTIREPKDRIAKEESQRVEEWDNVKAMMDADYKLATKLQVEEQEELTIEEKSKNFVELMDKRKKHFAAKRAEELRRKPPTKAQKRKYMSTYLKNMAGWKLNQLKHKTYDEVEKLFDQAMVKVNNLVDMDSKVLEGTSKRAGSELEQEAKKKQKIEDDKEITKLQLLVKITPGEEEVAVDAIPLATKPSAIVDYSIYKEGRTSYYKITRADGKYMLYTMFSLLLKSFDREDLEPLWKLVKARHGETRP